LFYAIHTTYFVIILRSGRMSSTHQDGSGAESNDRLRELALREREIQIKADEFTLKRTESEKTSRLTPILIAVWTTAVAVVGNGVVSWLNGQQTYRLEQEKAQRLHQLESEKAQRLHQLESDKAQSAVILEIVKANGPDKAAGNLAFFVEIGVIAQERLRSYLGTRPAGQGPSTLASNEGSSSEGNRTTCPEMAGDYVVVDVHLGDEHGGLNVRLNPNKTIVGVMPATATGIDAGTCREGWCQIRYGCLTGWAYAQHLALRSTRLVKVTGLTELAELTVRRDPGTRGAPTGTLSSNATDIVKHVCQAAPLTNDEQWCQISSGKISGWVPANYLDDQVKRQTTNTSAMPVIDSILTISPTPAATTSPRTD
jgi:uncharacterized protein YraI